MTYFKLFTQNTNYWQIFQYHCKWMIMNMLERGPNHYKIISKIVTVIEVIVL